MPKAQAARLRASNLIDAQVHSQEEQYPERKFEFNQPVDILEIRENKTVFVAGKGVVVGYEWAGNHREFRVEEWLYYIKVPGRQDWLRILESRLNAKVHRTA